RPLMRLFGDDPEVIAHGVRYLRLIAFMYIMPAFTNGIQGYFRGVGRLKLTLAASMINMGTRVGTAAVLVIGLGLGIEALPWSYFAGWVAMLCLQVPILAQELKKRSSARSS
ncbi:MAG: MATE family efflux transporter, partial [Lachnospiraceae bacterium]|nr:MATE family efflux transporter [Lachnospiraceae bacterium]